jgi:branched-chain amino acid transport system ATP-binding protein
MSLLELSDLTKQFGALTAVDEVSLSVDEGETRSIIGPNGAGKSTLFNIVTGLLEPNAGTVMFNGQDITGKPPFKIARLGIARSFQITDVYEGLTTFENVRVAVQAGHDRSMTLRSRADSLTEVTERTNEILDELGLSEQAEQRVEDLSYGDKRKIEIGLVIANEPDLLLLDEPTAGMSREETASIVKLIQQLKNRWGFTLLLIEHDLEIVMNISDAISVLHEGRLVANGSPEEIQTNDRVKEAYLGEEL